MLALPKYCCFAVFSVVFHEMLLSSVAGAVYVVLITVGVHDKVGTMTDNCSQN